ncbi:DegT/DnrJ/EryC1/StrS family aminotransferase [Adhaeribacter aquaticus]|uniref:DegT/DnrJ/EryC1/StrS family aminotransferase n=1 Tax=Adhaeribacter aquaticus TaxID=299567 RepID=UPI000558EF04|nr:aminotransferase class I/II-fold pyridoxal phosphate-dependent enzyme [Adhaeribacter aquaticus]
MTPKPTRLFLSPPHMGGQEISFIQAAFEENYITTAGSNILKFEAALSQATGCKHAVALNSGTAALHLALRLLEIKPGDEVLCPTFTFVATANPILYQGATPVFIDSEPETWNICPDALELAIKDRLKKGKKPKALILVHLYGMPAKVEQILQIANQYGIPVIEDAAEALGSTYAGKWVGTFGQVGIYSFNGNKIITTSGGGALLSDNKEYADKALFLATQAKDVAPHYQHSEIGYNYRMSNISAGIGLGQLAVLQQRIQKRRANFEYYRQHLGKVTGVQFLNERPDSFCNRWLSCILLPRQQQGTTAQLRLALEAANIESRLLWKPLHLQPLYANCPYYGKGVAEDLFNQGLCLPSGTALTEEDLARVVAVIKQQIA